MLISFGPILITGPSRRWAARHVEYSIPVALIQSSHNRENGAVKLAFGMALSGDEIAATTLGRSQRREAESTIEIILTNISEAMKV
jgi:hypothetical protein